MSIVTRTSIDSSILKNIPHFIVAGGVVRNTIGQIALVAQDRGHWSLPKGHQEVGESLLDTARREITEETGIPSRFLRLSEELGTYQRYRMGMDGHDDLTEIRSITIFLFDTDFTELKPLDPENPEAKWVDPHIAVRLLTHEKDKEFLLSILSKITREVTGTTDR